MVTPDEEEEEEAQLLMQWTQEGIWFRMSSRYPVIYANRFLQVTVSNVITSSQPTETNRGFSDKEEKAFAQCHQLFQSQLHPFPSFFSFSSLFWSQLRLEIHIHPPLLKPIERIHSSSRVENDKQKATLPRRDGQMNGCQDEILVSKMQRITTVRRREI